jgi:hypothetical protein
MRDPLNGGTLMAASDSLRELAQRAKVAEDRVAAAKSQARSDVERETTRVRDAAQKKADQLQKQTAKAATGASQKWSDVQRTWSEHDASDAVAFAEAALEEAEYAVLNATLARMDADAVTK